MNTNIWIINFNLNGNSVKENESRCSGSQRWQPLRPVLKPLISQWPLQVKSMTQQVSPFPLSQPSPASQGDVSLIAASMVDNDARERKSTVTSSVKLSSRSLLENKQLRGYLITWRAPTLCVNGSKYFHKLSKPAFNLVQSSYILKIIYNPILHLPHLSLIFKSMPYHFLNYIQNIWTRWSAQALQPPIPMITTTV